MPSLLFETEPRARLESRGEFTCPHCDTVRPYTRVVVRKAVCVMGMELPGGRFGEYVECGECLSTYRPEVLAYDAGPDRPRVLAEYQRALRRVLALLVITDGRIVDAEVETVQRVFEAVCGETLSAAEVVSEAREVAQAPTTAARYLAQVIGYLNDHGKEQILRGAAMVSHADGSLHDREADMVRRLGAVMRLPPDRLARVMRAVA
jgi:uncharacterized tellurite resistance protein B-like protein